VREVSNKNNRIGIGLSGMADWLIQRRLPYEVGEELGQWLAVYRDRTTEGGNHWAEHLNMAKPKAYRAVAPAGTIGILAESTTGIEPLFCKAYKRRYLKGDVWLYQYVIDGAVRRWQEMGIPSSCIFDSYDLSFEQRVRFQADVQDYVDHSIASTVNLPPWGTDANNDDNLPEKAAIVLKYAKRIRGLTCYPDGCRSGQPLTRVSIELAQSKEGQVFEEKEHLCVGGVCGI
jgi:ribonucleoside-diphosphate reductase alpha chain